MRPSFAFVAAVALSTTTTALEALINSPCAIQCGNNLGSTGPNDIACHDADYYSTPGSTFQTCVQCQITSKYVDPATKQTDLQWGLYNLRYAISTCLFGFPNNTAAIGDSPCQTSKACGPLENAFEFDSLATTQGALSYCSLYPATTVSNCNLCLGVSSTDFYLNNFVVVLNAACQQQPIAGSTISIQGTPFSKKLVNITTPSNTPSSSYNGPATGGLNLGAKIGIVVGGILLILAISGFCIVWNGRRRRRRVLRQRQRESGYDDEWKKQHEQIQQHMFQAQDGIVTTLPVSASSRDADTPLRDGGSSAGGFFDSPQSQRPLVSAHPWAGRMDEESPIGEKVYFSPYSSHYSSPVSANDQVQIVGREWPLDRKGSLTGAPLSTVGVGRFNSQSRSRSRDRDRKDRREVEGDRIELQNVAPVLSHPGNGRGRDLKSDEIKHNFGIGGFPPPPPGPPPLPRKDFKGLTAEDARNGNAV